jgi:hypothetical protein
MAPKGRTSFGSKSAGSRKAPSDSSDSDSTTDAEYLGDLQEMQKVLGNLSKACKRHQAHVDSKISKKRDSMIRKRERKRLRLNGIAEKKGNDGEDEDEDDDGGIDGVPDKEKGGDDKDEGDDKNGPPPPPASGPSGLLAICAA